jgi:hypothetical protein
MIGSFNKLLRNVASIKGKSAFDKVRMSLNIESMFIVSYQGHI